MDERFNELVEQLKNNKKDFGLCELEEQEVFRKVGIKNCNNYCLGGWNRTENSDFINYWCYRINPDYKPEPEKPEFVKVEIVKCKDELLGVVNNGQFDLPFSITLLHCLPSLQSFDHFEIDEEFISIERVAKCINDGFTVYAVFRR